MGSLTHTIPESLLEEIRTESESTIRHESIHVLYSRRLGFSPRVYGPELLERNGQPWFRLASVEGLPPKIQATGDPISVAKVFLGPCVLGFGNTQADLDNFIVWCAARFPDSQEEKIFLQVMDSVQADMEDPKFHAELRAITSEVRDKLSDCLKRKRL